MNHEIYHSLIVQLLFFLLSLDSRLMAKWHTSKQQLKGLNCGTMYQYTELQQDVHCTMYYVLEYIKLCSYSSLKQQPQRRKIAVSTCHQGCHGNGIAMYTLVATFEAKACSAGNVLTYSDFRQSSLALKYIRVENTLFGWSTQRPKRQVHIFRRSGIPHSRRPGISS